MGIFKTSVKKLVEKNDIEGLVKLLSAKNPETRISAFLALVRSTDDRALSSMKKLLDDPDPRVRTVATLKFGTVKMDEMAENLVQIIKYGTTHDRIEALNLMADRGAGDPKLTGILLATLEDKNYMVRRAAIRTLGAIKEVHAVERLIQCLDGEHIHVRMEAMKSLGIIRDLRAVNPLIGSLVDRHSEVRAAAHSALERIGSKEALNALNNAQFVMLVKKMGGNEHERLETATHIGAIALREGVPLLVKATMDTYKEVRIAAAKSIGLNRDREGIEALTRLLDDKYFDVRLEAVRALANIHVKESIEVLEIATKDKIKAVRTEASGAIKAIQAKLGI